MVFATARTQVDKVARTVVFEDLHVTKSDFPTLPDHGAAYAAELQTRFAGDLKTISLDRLEASLAAAGVKPPTVAVNNTPPQVIVSYSPAILVPIDGAPVLKPVPESLTLPARHQYARADPAGRTRTTTITSMSTTAGCASSSHCRALDAGVARAVQEQRATASRRQLAKAGAVDLLDGGPKANPKPSLANGVPTIYTIAGCPPN